MLLTSEAIREVLKDIWPQLSFVWLKNREFYAPPLHEIRTFLKKSKVDGIEFRKWNTECDYFALQLHAEAKEYFKERGPATIGEAFGNMFHGIYELHQLNVGIADDKKVYIIEPQTDGIWEADPLGDNILILTM